MSSSAADSVFTKMTPNGKITLFIPQREFVDYLSWIQPIDAAIVVDREYVHPERSIAVQLVSTVRYGREDDEVMGLNLSKEICLANVIVNKVPISEHLTEMQANLLRIYGDTCYPFHFEWPSGIGPSLTIQQPSAMKGEPCGIKHFIEVFCLYRGSCQPHKRSTIQFDVDLIQRHGSAEKSAVWIPPAVTVSRPLLLALGRVDMEVCLEKTSVVDGEPLIINISITNQSNKNIRGMKITLTQFYKLSFSEGKRKVPVNRMETHTGFPIAPGGTLNQTVMLVPRATTGTKQEGLAVRRCVSSNVSQLAPSTLFADPSHSDIFGFIISYRVHVKLKVSQTPLKATVMAEVPVFIVAKRDSEHFSHQPSGIEKCPGDSSINFRNRRFLNHFLCFNLTEQ
ncbi:hypothetical protein OUZ56_016770 [Daphnia magna]|uniref:Arrestin C-terminal-like domain-containing protein n=1 Tax=Daphnia magna TaxID=35525 RepID=A0ABR0ARH3_9CRUS|nr:hypothetical protein OUZ56_016770 [Daphnia magna]